MPVNRVATASAAAFAIGVLAVSVGGVGIAIAANGGSLTIGHTNVATNTTTLSNSHGAALSLHAGHGKAALLVNTSRRIRHLNASLLAGSSAKALKTSGSAAFTGYGGKKEGVLRTSGTMIAETARLAAGTYYVSSYAEVAVPTDEPVGCRLSTSNLAGKADFNSSTESTSAGIQSIAETAPLAAKKGQRIGYFCRLGASSDSTVIFEAGLTAIRVDSSAKGKTAHGGAESLVRPKR
jgi:hypothetical protein